MRYLSVFSGIEAATVAWKPLGWTTVAYAEIEKFPCAVLKYHYPETPNWGDITKYHDWPDETVDLVIGGCPCQSFSVAGRRKGLDDPRGNLTLVYLGIIERYRPRWVVFENVPGLLSIDGGRAFGAFLGGLAKCGYGFAWRILDAQYSGVPQRRRRVFVVGHLGAWQPAAAVLLNAASLRGDTPPSREAGERVAPSVTGGPPFSRTGNERVEDEAMICGALTRRMQGSSGWAPYNETEHLVCGAVSANYQSGIQQSMVVRRLTPRECERLQSFPDDYTLIPWRGKPMEQCPDGPRYKALGNSMVTLEIGWIGRRIQMVDEILGGK